jgi:DNA-binding CsgD family transcriptional regulator
MAGRFVAARELTREALERTEEIGGKSGLPWEVGFHAVALARLGELAEAESTARQVVPTDAVDPAVGLDALPARLALGLVSASRGDPAEAAAQLRVLDRLKHDAGIREPRLCAHGAELIEALLATGELDEAADVHSRLAEEAASSGGRSSQAASARCQSMLLAAQGEVDEAVAICEQSLALYDALPMPFERARTLLLLGQLRRRRREKRLAREALEHALTAFEDAQAPVWAERARTELARIPGHGPAGGLTPTEEIVARLAAEGLTNREIAERAFLSLKTVEVNLTRVYRKLGVRRAALASRLTELQGADAPTT